MSIRLESVSNVVSAEFRKVETSKKEAALDNKTAKTRKKDGTTLSNGAKELSETQASHNLVSTRIEVEPEIRTNRIKDVKSKIEAGYYNSSEFASSLADKLINDMFS